MTDTENYIEVHVCDLIKYIEAKKDPKIAEDIKLIKDFLMNLKELENVDVHVTFLDAPLLDPYGEHLPVSRDKTVKLIVKDERERQKLKELIEKAGSPENFADILYKYEDLDTQG